LHSRKLRVIDSFDSYVRPDWNDTTACTEETMKFHADHKKVTVDEFKKTLDAAPPIETVWPTFTNWVDQHNWSENNKTGYRAPIAAGHNIVGFDNIITKRHCLKYGPTEKDKRTGRQKQRLFNDVFHYDLQQHTWFWFENTKEVRSVSLTNLLEYMGVPKDVIEGAHDARFDVEWTRKILVKIFNMERYMTSWNEEKKKRRLEFKDCFR
jgi:DNA polymerase III epsilon subunit-like protein